MDVFEDKTLKLHSGARLVRLPSPPLSWIKRQRRVGPNWSDQLRLKDVATMPQPTLRTFDHKPLEVVRGQTRDGDARGGLTISLPDGPHNVKLQIQGTLPGGAPFKRVVLRTVGVQPGSPAQSPPSSKIL